MRTLFVLLAVMFVLFSSAAVAGPPPGVGPSVLVTPDDDSCAVGYEDDDGFVPVYLGEYTLRYSNGATGHMTFKCKMELLEGFDPFVLYWEFADSPLPGCYSTVSLEGEKGTWMGQCFGYWEE